MLFSPGTHNIHWTFKAVRTILFIGEDQLSEALARRCVKHVLPDFEFASIRPGQGGRSGVESKFNSYLGTARGAPVFVMLDLDDAECPPSARHDLLSRHHVQDLPGRFILSIVRHESEAWLLGDQQRLSQFLGVVETAFPARPEELFDPKEALVSLASQSRKFKRGLCPAPNTSAKVGPDYNYVLEQFVSARWRPEVAATICPTLNRTLNRLENLLE